MVTIASREIRGDYCFDFTFRADGAPVSGLMWTRRGPILCSIGSTGFNGYRLASIRLLRFQEQFGPEMGIFLERRITRRELPNRS